MVGRHKPGFLLGSGAGSTLVGLALLLTILHGTAWITNTLPTAPTSLRGSEPGNWRAQLGNGLCRADTTSSTPTSSQPGILSTTIRYYTSLPLGNKLTNTDLSLDGHMVRGNTPPQPIRRLTATADKQPRLSSWHKHWISPPYLAYYGYVWELLWHICFQEWKIH